MMIWILAAAIVNTLWTLWCAQNLPTRVATHFGLGGNPDGWMSRKSFALFGILFPPAMAVFIVVVSRSDARIQAPMEHVAAGLILFFSAVSWSIVRSNRKTNVRVDYPSLLLSLAAFIAFIWFSVGGISQLHNPPRPVATATRG
jgi:hypothetical protein